METNVPYRSFRFSIHLDGVAPAGFSDCNGLQVDLDVQEYAEGGVNTHTLKFPTRAKQVNLILKRGIVDRSLWAWYQNLRNGTVERKSGSIRLRDPGTNDVVAEWRIREAFPCRWTGPELSAKQNSLAVEALELCHQGLEWTERGGV